jgi:hypothetical protein
MCGERTSLSSSLDGAHGDCERVAEDSGGAGLQKRQDDVLTTRVVGDRPLSHHRQRQWQWDNFSQRDVTMPRRIA